MNPGNWAPWRNKTKGETARILVWLLGAVATISTVVAVWALTHPDGSVLSSTFMFFAREFVTGVVGFGVFALSVISIVRAMGRYLEDRPGAGRPGDSKKTSGASDGTEANTTGTDNKKPTVTAKLSDEDRSEITSGVAQLVQASLPEDIVSKLEEQATKKYEASLKYEKYSQRVSDMRFKRITCLRQRKRLSNSSGLSATSFSRRAKRPLQHESQKTPQMAPAKISPP